MKGKILLLALAGVGVGMLAKRFMGKEEEGDIALLSDGVTKGDVDGESVKADVPPVVAVEEEMKEEEVPADVCFFTEMGTVWHRDPVCHYISKSGTLTRGTLLEARVAGKICGCKRCAGE